jgi:hypothetical protein
MQRAPPRSMRLRSLMKPFAFALIAGAILVRRYRRRAHNAALIRADRFAADPADPVQSLHEVAELQVMPLDFDAQSQRDAEAAQDLASLEIDVDETADRDDSVITMADIENVGVAPGRDAGELYGVHTPAAVDRTHLDDDRAFADGQNWLEALETSAIENGADPEHELDDILDDRDVMRGPHASDTRDRPVADHGSGGRRGL